MALSDCEKCWETPCICGYKWKQRSLDYLREIRKVIDEVIKEKENAAS